MNILQNENLIIESNTSGGELTRIYSKKHNKDFLWCGDNKHWGRRSPILFPIVGKLFDNETKIEDNIYSMTQHGFARDMKFEVIDLTKDSVSYRLVADESTKKFYPYLFELIIKYTLNQSTLTIEWNVKNIDSKEIYFSIGAHPAFNLFNLDTTLDKHYLTFKHKGNVEKIDLEGPHSSTRSEVKDLTRVDLTPNHFVNDALIYTNVDEIEVHSENSASSIKVNFEGFPLVGIWTPYYKETNTVAPFICIEPWYGLADNINSDKEYKNKDYINKLDINGEFTASYSIEIC